MGGPIAISSKTFSHLYNHCCWWKWRIFCRDSELRRLGFSRLRFVITPNPVFTSSAPPPKCYEYLYHGEHGGFSDRPQYFAVERVGDWRIAKKESKGGRPLAGQPRKMSLPLGEKKAECSDFYDWASGDQLI